MLDLLGGGGVYSIDSQISMKAAFAFFPFPFFHPAA